MFISSASRSLGGNVITSFYPRQMTGVRHCGFELFCLIKVGLDSSFSLLYYYYDHFHFFQKVENIKLHLVVGDLNALNSTVSELFNWSLRGN